MSKKDGRAIASYKRNEWRESLPSLWYKSPKARPIRAGRSRRRPTKTLLTLFNGYHLSPKISFLIQKSPKPFANKSFIEEMQVLIPKPPWVTDCFIIFHLTSDTWNHSWKDPKGNFSELLLTWWLQKKVMEREKGSKLGYSRADFW